MNSTPPRNLAERMEEGVTITISGLPLYVQVTKKKSFILNLNNYRNAHFRVLAKAKENYTHLIQHLVPKSPIPTPCTLEFVYYASSNRSIDLSNPCSIIDKFVCDALVKYKALPDDNHKHVASVKYTWGGVDKEKPRCDLIIRASF
jgi:hypothetical protein